MKRPYRKRNIYFLHLLFWNYYLNWKKKRRFKLNICNRIAIQEKYTSLISKMAANKEEPVAAANKEEPASFECFLRRSWPWPPLSKPRRSPRGHPEPKPYIRRAKRQPS